MASAAGHASPPHRCSPPRRSTGQRRHCRPRMPERPATPGRGKRSPSWLDPPLLPIYYKSAKALADRVRPAAARRERGSISAEDRAEALPGVCPRDRVSDEVQEVFAAHVDVQHREENENQGLVAKRGPETSPSNVTIAPAHDVSMSRNLGLTSGRTLPAGSPAQLFRAMRTAVGVFCCSLVVALLSAGCQKATAAGDKASPAAPKPSGFAFAVYGDSRSMMYLPHQERRRPTPKADGRHVLSGDARAGLPGGGQEAREDDLRRHHPRVSRW